MMSVMNRSFCVKAVGIVLASVVLSACGFKIPFIDTSSDYQKGTGSSKPLEVPPDLTAVNSSDAYNVPGSTSYSAYSQSQEDQEPGVEQVLRTPDGVRMEKAGSQRWLVVDAPAEKVWPVVREFWLEQGFAVRVEDADVGVMETEWVRTDDIEVKEDKRKWGDRFDSWMDKLSGLADKRKFRTRLERGEVESTTEVYMTHRAVRGAPDDGKNKVQTQLGEIDTGYRADAETNDKSILIDQYERDLDAELMRRLMVKLGVSQAQANQIAKNPVREQRAEVVKESDQSVTLTLKDGYARGWRRVGLALDRVGFVVEDKDRSNGLFYVRYADVDIDDTPQKKKGLLDILGFGDEEEIENKSEPKDETTVIDKLKFWKGKDELNDPSKKYRIKVSEADEGTKVNIVDEEGNPNPTTTANKIISLLYDQLK